MKLTLTKKEIVGIIKEHYRNPAYLELGMTIGNVEINEYAEKEDEFCIITLIKEVKQEVKKI